MKYLSCFSISVLLIFACSKSKPALPMSEKAFQKFYSEAYQIYAESDSSSRGVRIDSLLKARQVTMQDIQKMVDRYNENPQEWVDFYKGVDQVMREKKQIETQQHDKPNAADTTKSKSK